MKYGIDPASLPFWPMNFIMNLQYEPKGFSQKEISSMFELIEKYKYSIDG